MARPWSLSFLLLTALCAAPAATQQPALLNWAADDEKRVADLAARGRRLEGTHVIVWMPAVVTEGDHRALVDRLDGGVAAVRALVGTHEWQSIRDQKITYYISEDRFVSHGSGRAAVFIPLARVKDGKAPYLHEAMHELLATSQTGRQRDAERYAWIATLPLWLAEGLPDYVAQTAASMRGVVEGDVFEIGGLEGADRACATRLGGPAGPEVLQYMGAPGRPDALFTTERQTVAPTFYACSFSFTKYVVDRVGLAATVSLIPLISSGGVHAKLEALTGTTMSGLRSDWLRTIGYAASEPSSDAKRITILYDAFGQPSALERDWGFAALVDYGGRRILFDTGNDAGIFERNVERLGVDLTRLDAVVISHRHGDHTTGLSALLRRNPGVTIYTPQETAFFKTTAPRAFVAPHPALPATLRYFGGQPPAQWATGTPWEEAKFETVTKTTEILPGFHVLTTQSQKPGSMEMNETSLAIRTPKGLAVVVGCSHPGVEEILEQVARIDPTLYTVTGGFHLVMTPRDEVERVANVLHDTLKVERVAPGHCTSELGLAVFLERFKDRFDQAGVGAVIPLP